MGTDNFAQPCCVLEAFEATLYAPDSGKCINLTMDRLLDYEVRTTISLVQEALLIYEDNSDISSLIDTNKNLWLYVYYAENGAEKAKNAEYKVMGKDFRVLSTQKETTQNKTYLKFELQDAFSYFLSKYYKSQTALGLMSALQKAYSDYLADKTWIEPSIRSIKKFRTEYLIDSMFDNSELIQFTGNSSFLKEFNDFTKRFGAVCYSENGILRLANLKKISALQILDIYKFQRYSYDYSNATTYLYYSKFFEASNENNSPQTDYYTIDYSTKKLKIQSSNLKDTGLSKETQETEGSRLQYVETQNPDRLYRNTYLEFLNNYGAYIVVPGRKSQIAILNKVKIESYTPSENNIIKETGDLKRSGEFIVTGYTNKIVNRNKLVTLARLNRFDS